jgi:hypothetical protein
MAQPQLNSDLLKQVIAETLSPYGETRRAGKSLDETAALIFGNSLEV